MHSLSLDNYLKKNIMKKNLLSIFGIAASFGAFAQLPVSTMPDNKNVVLEEFTGIQCTWCPAGHAIANGIAANNPGDVVLINIHTGSFATPTGPGTDFRTAFGTPIAGQTNLAGYPAGTVNRHEFAGLQQNTTGTAMSRGDWDQAATQILGEASYVNLALEGTIDYDTRILTVDVEAHFTGVAPASVNLNVALLQNNIEGPQTGASGNPSAILPNGKYNHMHMLRHLLTGQWGEVVTATGQGTTYSNQFTYTIPADLNGVDLSMGNFEIVGFIAEGQQEIVTGAKGPLTYVNVPNNNATAKSASSATVICNPSIEPSMVLKNNGGNDITSATIVYDVAGQNSTTYNWTGTLASWAEIEITLPAIAVPTTGGVLNVEVTAVNGGTDSDNTDNTTTGAAISFTNDQGVGEDLIFEFAQDRYGSESTWEILDEVSGAVLASGGPYSDLSANGTLLHATPVTIPATACYVVKAYDSYGDGINSGYGAGFYRLKNNLNNTILISTGAFGSEESKPFEITSLETGLGIDESNTVSSMTVFPNPVTNIANIQFYIEDANNATLTVYNMLGEVVYTNSSLEVGQNMIAFDVAELGAGMYFTTVKTANGNTSTKFTVAK
jgi:hypothetical protein